MHAMDSIDVLKKVASLSKNAKSWGMSEGEQVSYLHQTLLAISNILDYEEDKLHRFKGIVEEENSVHESPCAGSLESGYPSTILQLYTQRLSLQANAPVGFQSVSLQSSLSRRDDSNHLDDNSIFLVLLEVVSSLGDLCHDEWKHLSDSEHRQTSGTKSDPFSKNLSFLDEQCHELFIQQLNALQGRCKKLAEEEEKAIAAVKTSREVKETLLGRDRDRDGGVVSFEECAWRITERLAGYEECLDRLLGDLWNWTDDQGIKVLEDNQQLLIEARWVKKLMALALEFKRQRSKTATTRDETERHKRVLKLSSDCFAALPLPLQSTLFQWLWDQPNGPTLFKDSAVIHVEQELTHVFNRLVSGSTDTQLTERAREICSIALHCPSSTLQKAIQEAISNADAGRLICKVLQCMPFLVQLQLDGVTCFLTELSSFVSTLGVRQLSSSEELNLFKFADGLVQSYHPPTHPGNPITCPPPVSPLHLADSCIWPFLGTAPLDHTLRPGPGPPSLYLAPESTTPRISVPRRITLKFLDLVLINSLSSTDRQEPDALDISVCFSTMLSLCQILHDCTVPDGGDVTYNFLVKEMTSDLLERVSAHVRQVHTDNLSVCLEWLAEETSDLDWTVRLALHALFSHAAPSCRKEVISCIEQITGCIQPSPTIESVPLYGEWSCSLMALFQGARISSRLSKQFVKSLSGTFLPKTSSLRSDFYRAVCLGLARVLPHSSTPEWLTILDTLGLMRSEGLLHVSYTSHFMTSLPACDITVCQRPLQLSQVFTTVIQLLSEAGFSDRLKDDQWQHITKSYAQLMKKILSNATESISSGPSSSAHAAPQVFLIGQLFCQSCEVSRCVPASATEQLFVWCLELVTRVEELLSCHSDDNDDGVVVRDVVHQEMKTLSRAIEWLSSSGQRSTLLQKVGAMSSRC